MFLQDLRYALRTLRSSPAFTLVVVACLSLGIGVNAMIFSVVDGVLLQPFPYPDAERLLVLNAFNPRAGINRAAVSYADFKDWRDENTTFASMAAFTQRSLTIADGSTDPERYNGATISWNLFEMLGTQPAIGRSFGSNDDRPGAEPVVLLSDDVWRRRYNGDTSIVGRAILINARLHTVIGVMPPNFRFPETQRLWVPIAPYEREWTRQTRNIQIFGRLRPGVTYEQADADLKALTARLEARYPDDNKGWSGLVRSLRSWMVPDQVDLVLKAMMGAVTLVLMIACANVANLLLARASARHREISIRAALGAGKWRIVRQLLTESVILGLISAPLGYALAAVGMRMMDAAIPTDSIPYFIHWSLDLRSVGYLVAVSMLTGVIFGLAPAVQAARSNLTDSLKEGARGATGGKRARLRSTLVVAEIAMSLVLLIGASLFVRSFLNLQNSTSGFDTAPLMTMRFYLPGTAYETPEAKARRVEDIVQRVEGLPGVEAAFASNFVPFGAGGGGGKIMIEGRSHEPGKEPQITFISATPRLRQTLNVPLMQGRDLTEAEETTRTRVVLINQTMAKQLWPDENPLGRRFQFKEDGPAESFTVVGVIADFRHFQGDSDRAIFPSAYAPYSFGPTLNTGLTIRVAGDPTQITSAVREQIRRSDSALPVFSVQTMEQLRQLSFWQFNLFGWLFGAFGAIALVLASIGVYGVLSYSVSQRAQEIGVRVALGAERRDVLRLILGHGMKLAGMGIVLGIGLAAAATQGIKTILYNVTPTDPLSFGGVAVFLTLVALTASYIPARRAMAVDPIIALRNE
jgi:putative ABC transport system permease protein